MRSTNRVEAFWEKTKIIFINKAGDRFRFDGHDVSGFDFFVERENNLSVSHSSDAQISIPTDDSSRNPEMASGWISSIRRSKRIGSA